MKVSAVIYALVSAVPYLVQGSAIPSVENPVAVTQNPHFSSVKEVNLLSRELFTKRQADDEWLMVIYNNGEEGQQCGGVANDFTGKGSICWGLGNVVGKVCTDLKVSAGIGFAKCEFSFRGEGTNCGGSEQDKVTVNAGSNTVGYSLSDQVRFVQVTCSD